MAAQRISGTTNDSIRAIILRKKRGGFAHHCLAFAIFAIVSAVLMYVARASLLFYTDLLYESSYTPIIAIGFFLANVVASIATLLALFSGISSIIISVLSPRHLARAVISLIISLLAAIMLLPVTDLSLQLLPIILDFLL